MCHSLSSRYRRHDGDLIAILQGGVLPFEKPDVFFVHIDVDESAQFSGLIAQAIFQARMRTIERLDHVGNAAWLCLDFALPLGQWTKRSRNANFNHASPPILFPILKMFSKLTRLG